MLITRPDVAYSDQSPSRAPRAATRGALQPRARVSTWLGEDVAADRPILVHQRIRGDFSDIGNFGDFSSLWLTI